MPCAVQRPFGVIQPSSRELTPQAFGVYNQSVYNNSLAQKQRVANVGVTTAAEVGLPLPMPATLFYCAHRVRSIGTQCLVPECLNA